MNIRLIWPRSALTPTEQSLFGFVFFRQVKDESISRGYLQKSIVLISSVPYINLFKEVRRPRLVLIALNWRDTGRNYRWSVVFRARHELSRSSVQEHLCVAQSWARQWYGLAYFGNIVRSLRSTLLTRWPGHKHFISSAATEWRDSAAQQSGAECQRECRAAQRSGVLQSDCWLSALLTIHMRQLVTHLQGVNLYARFKVT